MARPTTSTKSTESEPMEARVGGGTGWEEIEEMDGGGGVGIDNGGRDSPLMLRSE